MYSSLILTVKIVNVVSPGSGIPAHGIAMIPPAGVWDWKGEETSMSLRFPLRLAHEFQGAQQKL